MADLSLFYFTDRSDTAISEDNWELLAYDGFVDAKAGNDVIRGTAGLSQNVGIYNFGTINVGAGNDVVNGIGGDAAFGILNNGSINCDTGNDVISGIAGQGTGFFNSGTINGDAGNDFIGGSAGVYGCGLFNDGYFSLGVIHGGPGNDIIRGASEENGLGIFNSGSIYGDAGDDIVDAINGGFAGDGIVDLGMDDDSLKGFGEGIFCGGLGTDKIVLGNGIYQVKRIHGSDWTITKQEVTMPISGFEQIGGARKGLFDLAEGTFRVTGGGIGSFL